MDYDLDALLSSPAAIALVPGFALLFLVARGLPAWLLYRGELDRGERLPLAFFSAAALPLVVAITEIGTEVGVMREQEASALVGAGMLSILLFPLIALTLRRRAARGRRLVAAPLSSNARRRSSERAASRLPGAAESRPPATLPRAPPGSANSLRYSNRVPPSSASSR